MQPASGELDLLRRGGPERHDQVRRRPTPSTSRNINEAVHATASCRTGADACSTRTGGSARQADRALPVAGDPQRRVRGGGPDRLELHGARVRRGGPGRASWPGSDAGLGRLVADDAAQGGRARRRRRGRRRSPPRSARPTPWSGCRTAPGGPRTPTRRAWSTPCSRPASSTAERSACSGAGGTARAALAAARDLGAAAVTVYARRPAAIDELDAGRGRPRPHPDRRGLGRRRAGRRRRRGHLHRAQGRGRPAWRPSIDWRAGAVLFDAVYDPWPTPLAAAAAAAGLSHRLRPRPAAGPGGAPVRAVHRGRGPGRRDAGRPPVSGLRPLTASPIMIWRS